MKTIAWINKDTAWQDVPGFRGRSDVESPLGEWTRIECVCAGDRITVSVNGKQVNEAFEALVEEKLTKPGSTRKRTVYLRAAEEHFDGYGRLLAYMAPNYTAKEREQMSRRDRATFNLLMVENGWAATFPIFPRGKSDTQNQGSG